MIECPKLRPAWMMDCLKQGQKHELYDWDPTAHLTEHTRALTPAPAPPMADAQEAAGEVPVDVEYEMLNPAPHWH